MICFSGKHIISYYCPILIIKNFENKKNSHGVLTFKILHRKLVNNIEIFHLSAFQRLLQQESAP